MNRLAIIICCLLVFGVFIAPSSAAAQSADLSLQKSDSADPVATGATFTYTITVVNNGPNNAKDSILTDTLPAGVTFVSAPNCTFASGIVTCDLGNIPHPQSRIRTITVIAPSTTGLISNTASVTTSVTDPNLSNNSDTETTFVEGSPVAANDNYSTNEDVTLNVPAPGVLANDTDPENDSLTAVLVSGPASGNLTLNSNGSFDYIPALNFTGIVTFTYTANDGVGNSNVATVTITVNPQNDAPVANADNYNVNEDNTLAVNAPGILSNDVDIDGDSMTAVLQNDVSNGTLTFNSDGSFAYSPNPNFTGTDSFTYMANDGNVNSNVATVTITVNPINDAPVANDDNYNVNEDETLTIAAPGVLSNDADIDGDSMTVALQANVSNGTLVLNSDGSFDYTPDADFSGTDSFTYIASDGSVDSIAATVTITVNPVNDDPVADDQSVTTNEDTDVAITLTASDLDGDTLTYSIVSDPTNGTLTGTPPDITYTPNPNYNGTDSFTFNVNDGQADSNNATVSITIDPVADAPSAVDDAYNVNEDSVLTVIAPGVLTNDSDADGDSLSAALQSNVSNGNLALNNDGSFMYTPNANFNGTDSFTYVASDGGSNSNIATVVITVHPVNDAPVAANDSYNVDEDNALNVPAPGILMNDSDLDGDALTSALQTNVSNGTLTLNGNGSFTYTPDEDFNGTDTFTYVASDGTLDSNAATVTITVNAVNDAPVANADSYVANEDQALTVSSANGVLSNDTDVEDDTLTAVGVTTPQNGTLTLNSNGSFTYTPNADFNGTDSFTYTANDGNLNSNAATVTITVGAVNDNPQASDDSAETDQDVAVTVDVLSNDSDVDGDTFSVTSVSTPANGTATNNGDGTITYTPNSGFFGTDSFDYTIDDGNGGTDTATVTVTVNEVIPPVTISIDDVTAVEPLTGSVNATLTVTMSDVSATDVTVDFTTADGTATAGSDYTSNSGTITIPAGSTTATITIEVLADSDAFEGNETVLVNLSNASGAVISDNQGVVTISETCLFCDDFEDGVLSTDWTYVKQTWTESNGSLSGTPAKRKAITVANPAFSNGCTTCSISAAMTTAGGARSRVWLLGWYIDKKNTVEVLMKEENDKWVVKQRSNRSVVSKGKGLATILPNVSYNVEITFDGTNFVLRVDGNLLATVPAKASVPSGTVGYAVKNTTGNFGYILVN